MKRLISLTLLTFSLVTLVGCCQKETSNKESLSQRNINIISYPEGYDTTSEGASSYENSGDHIDSKYFSQLDVYNLKSTDTLTILSNFKTYQQTKEYTCGPATALMVLEHFGESNYDELKISEIMECHKDLNGNNLDTPGLANEQGEYGTSTDRMVNFFNKIGWNVTSSLMERNIDDDYTFDNSADFMEWIINNLKNNTPIMVEWIDWAGHWSNIIGYDTMGTDSFGDDVLILADPYDTSDHLQDGYHIVPAERFFYMWFDKSILPQDQSVQQWLIAKPNN